MRNDSVFLKWLITISLIGFGFALAALTGLFHTINAADITKLSFVILGIFFVYSIRIGATAYRATYGDLTGRERLLKSVDFIVRLLVNIGMVGTVIGFIYLLSISLKGLEAATSANFRYALQSMGVGMGTALWTTACGLSCSILLSIQSHLMKSVE